MTDFQTPSTRSMVGTTMGYILTILGIFSLPVLLSHIVWNSNLHTLVYVVMWGIFTIDLLTRIVVAPDRFAYFKSHWTDVSAVIIPPIRPLRLLLDAILVVRSGIGVRRVLFVDKIAIYATSLAVTCACLVRTFEPVTFPTFSDSIWWAVVTMTTVGYGDISPTTNLGRAAALPLLVGGIALFGVFTATLASILIRERKHSAMTVTSKSGILVSLKSPCTIAGAKPSEDQEQPLEFVAVWDTGAVYSAVSKKVAEACGLTAEYIGGHKTYQVSIGLPNHGRYTPVQALEDTIDGADVRISMDIISTGDFAITNAGGTTRFSFRYPPSGDYIDFVAAQQ